MRLTAATLSLCAALSLGAIAEAAPADVERAAAWIDPGSALLLAVDVEAIAQWPELAFVWELWPESSFAREYNPILASWGVDPRTTVRAAVWGSPTLAPDEARFSCAAVGTFDTGAAEKGLGAAANLTRPAADGPFETARGVRLGFVGPDTFLATSGGTWGSAGDPTPGAVEVLSRLPSEGAIRFAMYLSPNDQDRHPALTGVTKLTFSLALEERPVLRLAVWYEAPDDAAIAVADLNRFLASAGGVPEVAALGISAGDAAATTSADGRGVLLEYRPSEASWTTLSRWLRDVVTSELE